MNPLYLINFAAAYWLIVAMGFALYVRFRYLRVPGSFGFIFAFCVVFLPAIVRDYCVWLEENER